MGHAGGKWLRRVASLRSVDEGVLVLVPAPGSRPLGERGAVSLGRSRRHNDKGGVRVRVLRDGQGWAARASGRSRPFRRPGARVRDEEYNRAY
jgi:hypothetical protein